MPVKNSLVPITPVNRDGETQRGAPHKSSLHSANRPDYGFIAHLIATSAKAPQTRARRRAEPGEAISAYNGLGQRPSAAGGVLRRSL
jgi:hypothetical protein